MTSRVLAPVVRISRLGEIDERAERRAYWAPRSIEERIAEVESLRRMWPSSPATLTSRSLASSTSGGSASLPPILVSSNTTTSALRRSPASSGHRRMAARSRDLAHLASTSPQWS